MRTLSVALLLGLMASVSAVAMAETTGPAPREKTLCVIQNTALKRPEFLAAYQKALDARHIRHRVVQAHDPKAGCTMLSTYGARWSVDGTDKLVFAEIKTFRNGRMEGRTVWDAGYDSGRPYDVNLPVQPKVDEMVMNLFPANQSL